MNKSYIALFFLLIASALFAQSTPPTSFQMTETLSPNKAFGIRYVASTDTLEVFDAAKKASVVTVVDRVFGNGRNTGKVLWSMDSRIAVLFLEFGRTTDIHVAINDGKTWKVLDDPFSSAKPNPLSKRNGQASCVYVKPVRWSSSHTLDVSNQLVFRGSTEEHYQCSIVIKDDLTSDVVNWKRLP